MKMSPKVVSRNVAVLYWLAFVGYSAEAAKSPGYVLHPESVPYPWLDLLFTAGLLAALTWALRMILTAPLIASPLKRVAIAWVFAAGTLIAGASDIGTDLPGLAYVPFAFSMVSLAGLSIYAVYLVGVFAWRLFRNVP